MAAGNSRTRRRKASRWRKQRYRTEYALFLFVRGLLRWLPPTGRFGVGPVLGRLAYRLDRRHRRVALENLRIAFPQLDERQRTELTRRCYRNLATSLADTVATSNLDPEAFRSRFVVENWRHLEDAEKGSRGLLMLTGHLGNWEATAQFMALHGRPVSFLARPLDNPHLEAAVRASRERFGNRSIPKRRGGRQMLETLRSGGRVGILLDQRVHPNEGRPFPFFGRPAYTSPLMAKLSLRTGVPVVPCFGIPTDSWRQCRIIFRAAIWPTGSGPAAESELTRRYLQVLEEEIRRWPDLWLWMHRRWRWNPAKFPEPSAQPNQQVAEPDNSRLVERLP